MNIPDTISTDWNDHYKAKPYIFPVTAGSVTGSIALNADQTTILPLHPEKLLTSDGVKVENWMLSLISADREMIIAQIPYEKAIQDLRDFITEERDDLILVRGLSENEMRMLADREENDPHVDTVVFTNMCLIYDGDNILVQDRLEKSWSGVTLPGGHVRPGESFVRSVIREVYEETGLTISDVRLCGIKQWIHPQGKRRYIVLIYKTDKFTGEIRSSDEGAVLWIDRSQINQYDLAKGLPEILKICENDDITEGYQHFEDDAWQMEFL